MMDSSWLIQDAESFESDLWMLPGLDSRQFYAAAYYLSIVQAQQKKERDATQTFDIGISDENSRDIEGVLRSDVVDRFLDLLALLFARFKKKSHTPGNVTATGLVIGAKVWDIWIAKNGGAYVNKMKNQGISSDHEFLEKLQDWFAGEVGSCRTGNDQSGGPDDSFWIEMIDFWSHRITHYVKQIQKGAELLPVEPSSSIPTAFDQSHSRPENVAEQASSSGKVQKIHRNQVWEFIQSKRSNIDKAEFEKEWDRAIELTENLKQGSGNGGNETRKDSIPESNWIIRQTHHKRGQESFSLHFEAFQKLHEFRNRASRQIYPPAKDPNDDGHPFAKSYREFRNRINNLEMLGTPLTMWKVFNVVRDALYSTGVTMEFNIVDTFPSFPMEKPTLAATIASWRGLEKSDHKARVLQALKEGESRPFTRYLHCELQMLRLLFKAKADGQKPHAYIGVSKLSCYFCWNILSNRSLQGIEFRTKEGHRRISANCAFAFDITAGYGYIPDAIAQLQASMLQNILREAVKLKINYTAYSLQDNTELASIPGSFNVPIHNSGTSRVEEPRFSTKDEIVRVRILRIDTIGRQDIIEVPLVYGDTLQPVRKIDLYSQNHKDESSQEVPTQGGSSPYGEIRGSPSQGESGDELAIEKNPGQNESTENNRVEGEISQHVPARESPHAHSKRLKTHQIRKIYATHPKTGAKIYSFQGIDFSGGNGHIFFKVDFNYCGDGPGNKWAYRALLGETPQFDLQDWCFTGDILVLKWNEDSEVGYEHIDHQTSWEQDFFENMVPPMKNRWEEIEQRNRMFWYKRLKDIEINLTNMLRRDYDHWERARLREEEDNRRAENLALREALSIARDNAYDSELDSRLFPRRYR